MARTSSQSDPDARLTAWLEDGPRSGPDDVLSNVLARARSTRQRPVWLIQLKGDTMDAIAWRARPLPSARVALVLLIVLLALALTGAALIVGAWPTSLIRVDNGRNADTSYGAAMLHPEWSPTGSRLSLLGKTGAPSRSVDA